MKNKLLQLFTLFIGSLIISLIIWNRFIRIRLPKEIIPDGSTTRIIIISCICLLFLLLLIYSVRNILNKPPRKLTVRIGQYLNNNYFFKEASAFIINSVLKAPKVVYEEIYQKVFMRPAIEYLGFRLTVYLRSYTYKQIFYLIIFIIIRVFIGICFLIDIVINKEFFYFYKFVPLLIIPLVTQVLLFIIEHHARSQIDYMCYFFLFTLKETQVIISFQPYLTTEERRFGLTVNTKAWYTLTQNFIQVIKFCDQITQIKDLYRENLNIVYYATYFVGFFVYMLILLNIY